MINWGFKDKSKPFVRQGRKAKGLHFKGSLAAEEKTKWRENNE